ncbi:MAG TPA: DMT family transporter [Trueperaceae bacterium]|nr:DMT family transporter [Trueperaceae bacterium]
MAPPGTTRVSLVLTAAIAAVSLSAIFIRLADAPGVVVALLRMVFASLVMAPVTLRGLRRTPLRGRALGLTVVAGALLGVHFATWITSLSMTSVAASVTLVTTAPLWVALFAWLFSGKAPSFSVLIGVVLAVGGAAIIGFGDLGGGTAPLIGDGLALLGAASAAGYLLLGRSVQRSGVGLDAYAGTAYATAAVVLAPLPVLFGFPYLGYSTGTFGWILLLALVPQLIGHNGINYAMRHVDPTLVATVILLEPVGATLLAFLIFGEVPSSLTLVGALVLLFGVVFTVRSTESPAPGAAPPEVPGD